MSVRAGVQTQELNRQISLLKHFPEVVEKHFRKMMAKNVAMLYSRIKSAVPVMTGNARSKFKKTLRGKGVNMQGKVGWWGADAPWYINVVEYGAGPHVIEPRDPEGFLRLNGNRFVKKVDHPGLSARGFMAAGFSAMQPIINADLKAAGDAVVKELAL